MYDRKRNTLVCVAVSKRVLEGLPVRTYPAKLGVAVTSESSSVTVARSKPADKVASSNSSTTGSRE